MLQKYYRHLQFMARGAICYVLAFFRAALHAFAFSGPSCRFVPTCSEYGADAVRHHGVIRGLFFTARRLSKCHYFGSTGYDPIPGGLKRGV